MIWFGVGVKKFKFKLVMRVKHIQVPTPRT